MLTDTAPVALQLPPDDDRVASAPAPRPEWRADILGDDYQQLTLPLRPDDEGGVVATLVRHTPAGGPVDGPLADADVLMCPAGRTTSSRCTSRNTGPRAPASKPWTSASRAAACAPGRRPASSPTWRTTTTTSRPRSPPSAMAATTACAGGSSSSGTRPVGWCAACGRTGPWPGGRTGAEQPVAGVPGRLPRRVAAGPILALCARFTPQGELPRLDLGHYARSLLRSYAGEWD